MNKLIALFLFALCSLPVFAQLSAPGGALPTPFERVAALGEELALVKVLAADPYGADVEVLTAVKGTKAGEKLRVAMPGADIYCTPELDTAGAGSQWVLARRRAGLGAKAGTAGEFETQLLRVEDGRVLLTAPEAAQKRYVTVAELVERYGVRR
jgi:hypothetical protein